MITSIVGLAAGIFLVINGIVGSEGGRLIYFYDLSSIFITVGGTISALLIGHPWSLLKTFPKMILLAFKPPKYDPNYYINEMVEYAKVARSKSLLALEENANVCKEPFIKSSLMLIVDANDSERVQEMLDSAIDFVDERHTAGISFFERGSATAPAFGMIGTLIGLINMLMNLEGNSAGLGAGMSVALITTFYGCMMANLFFQPIANKLKSIHESELLCMEIVKSGALAIISGANPRYIEEKLNFMLPRGNVKKVKNEDK